MRHELFAHIQTFSFSNLDKFSTAGLVTRMTTDVTNIQMAYQMLLRICFRAPVSMICAMSMAYLINARLATVYLIALVLLAIVLFLIIRRAMKYFQMAFPKYDELNASVQENVSAIRVVKAYVREEYETSKLQRASQAIYDIFIKAEKNVVLNMPVMQFTVYTCILLISWMGAKMIVQSELTTGELMSLMTYCMNILMSLMMVAMIFVMMSMSIASARRISEVLNEKSDLTNPVNPIYEVPSGEIEFRNVNFSYYNDENNAVLQDISLKIREGETVGTWAAMTCGNMIWTACAIRCPWCCRRTCFSRERSWRICAGAMPMPARRNAGGYAGWPVRMSSWRRCRRAITLT